MREIFCGQKCRVYIADLVHPIWGVKAEVWCCRVHCASRCVETSTTESEKFGCHSEVIKRTPQFPSCSVVSSMGGPDYCNWAQQLTAREAKVKRNSSISIFQDVLPAYILHAVKHGAQWMYRAIS